MRSLVCPALHYVIIMSEILVTTIVFCRLIEKRIISHSEVRGCAKKTEENSSRNVHKEGQENRFQGEALLTILNILKRSENLVPYFFLRLYWNGCLSCTTSSSLIQSSLQSTYQSIFQSMCFEPDDALDIFRVCKLVMGFVCK